MIVWITGRPASGKTTLGRTLVSTLEARGTRASLIDSDEVRAVITPNASYTPEERLIVYRSLAYLAARAEGWGVVPVVAATAHEPALRDAVRAIVPRMLLVHARCPLSVAEARDPKGLYRRARQSPDGAMPGVHVPFVEPDDADLVIDTDREIPASAVEAIVTRVVGS